MLIRGFCAFLTTACLLSGCGGRFASDYASDIPPDVSRDWRVTEVRAVTYDSRTVSNDNILVPMADIVWHGEPDGDRRAQVAAIIAEAARTAAAPLGGSTPVELHIAVDRFHGVTPLAVNLAPAAVHDIVFRIGVVDSRTRDVLVPPERITAPLPALTQHHAIRAQLEGETERQRIVDHVAGVTAGWLGAGPDMRASFVSLGF